MSMAITCLHPSVISNLFQRISFKIISSIILEIHLQTRISFPMMDLLAIQKAHPPCEDFVSVSLFKLNVRDPDSMYVCFGVQFYLRCHKRKTN